MGINYVDARILLEAKLKGASFTNTLTVAHLSLKLHPEEVKSLRQTYLAKIRPSPSKPLEDYTFGDYSDEFLRGFLGVSSLEILDYSSYQGATIICDLNCPVPDHLRGRFDAIIDGGSLEHVFNFPIAVANLMNMLKIGGHIFIKSPANNLCGHGFYQFSPELMFRVFSEENGFKLDRLVFVESTYPSVELTPYRNAYEVADPKATKTRVGLISNRPVVMIVQAKKTANVPVFAKPPLQSDYVAQWSQTNMSSSRGAPFANFLRGIFNNLPVSLQSRIYGHRELRRYSLSNGRFYRRLER